MSSKSKKDKEILKDIDNIDEINKKKNKSKPKLVIKDNIKKNKSKLKTKTKGNLEKNLEKNIEGNIEGNIEKNIETKKKSKIKLNKSSSLKNKNIFQENRVNLQDKGLGSPNKKARRSRRKPKKFKSKLKLNYIWIIRHLHRLDREEPKKWIATKRYRENQYDTPLNTFGKKCAIEAGLQIAKNTPHIKRFKYIYTSPFTRCIQTSLGIVEGIKKHTGKELQIRIEYGLAEYVPINLEQFYVQNQTLFKIRQPILDYHLAMPQLLKEYGNNIDKTYKSLYTKADIESETIWDSSERTVKVMNNITNNYKNIIICSHQLPVTIANMFLYNRQYPSPYLYKINPPKTSSSRKNTDPKRESSYGILSAFQKEDERWKYIYPPDNSYILDVNIDDSKP